MSCWALHVFQFLKNGYCIVDLDNVAIVCAITFNRGGECYEKKDHQL